MFAVASSTSQSVEELGDVELNKGYFSQGGAT
jgi:hypothetical protein